MKRNKTTGTFFKQKSYLLAAGLMVAAIAGMTGVYFSEQGSNKMNQAELEQQQFAEAEEGEAKEATQNAKEELKNDATKEIAEDGTEKTKSVEHILQPQNDDFLDEPAVISTKTEEETEESTETEEVSAVAEQKELHFDASTEMNWPLQGNVLMNYSMEQTTYFATLDQYKYNPAIVIQGNVNDKILSVADGKVSNIETNEVTGCTVTVDLGDGYTAVYGQLKEVPVSVGDYVEAGAIMGYVSEPTKYYSVEGPNLYFQMMKDSVSVDPMEYLQ